MMNAGGNVTGLKAGADHKAGEVVAALERALEEARAHPQGMVMIIMAGSKGVVEFGFHDDLLQLIGLLELAKQGALKVAEEGL
jgi:hypothetical protein